MKKNNIIPDILPVGESTSRRHALKMAAGTVAGMMMTSLGMSALSAGKTPDGVTKKKIFLPKAFVYTELQIAIPFEEFSWDVANKSLLQQPGLLNKTWLSGIGNNSLGGIYAFDSVEKARKFVTGYFPAEAKKSGVAQTTRLFDAAIVDNASRDLQSVHFGHHLDHIPAAFVYTELQVSVPFDEFPWEVRNKVLKKQPGLLAKTWLSGLNTNSLGGIDAFDTIENARQYTLVDFPRIAAKSNAAFYTRIFDARVVEAASRQMHSPFYS